MDKLSPFEIAGNLYTRTEPMDSAGMGYMIRRVLSMSGLGFVEAQKANEMARAVGEDTVTDFLKIALPRLSDSPRAAYVKKPKVENPEHINLISRTFKCNPFHSAQILEIFKRSEIPLERIYGMKVSNGRNRSRKK